MSDPVEVVALDVMDTVLRDPYREALSAAVDVPLAELFARRDPEAYPALERGEIDEDAYWRAFRDAGIAVDVAAFHRVRRDGYAFLDGMRGLLDDLRGRVRVVTASNYPCWIDEVARDHLAGLVDDVIASCHLGARKPDAAFYERLVDRLGVAPNATLFVDDRPANVDGARAVGLRAHRYADTPGLRACLRSAGVL